MGPDPDWAVPHRVVVESLDVPVAGVRLRVRRAAAPAGAPAAAQGAPVVLVHGLGVSGLYLLPLARRLARGRTVWVPDLPGHGRSESAAEPLDVPGLAAALRLWMDAAGVERAVLVGQSLGSQVVAELAAVAPERVAGLVLVSPTPDPVTRSVPRAVLRLLADVPFERPSLVPLVLLAYLRAGPRLVLAEYRAMRLHRLERALERVRAAGIPCRVVRGSRDTVVRGPWAARVAGLAGAPPPETVAGAAHAVQHSHPAAVAAVVDAVVREAVARDAVARDAVARDAAGAFRSSGMGATGRDGRRAALP